MSEAQVIKATFSEWRMVKSRKVLQLVFEVPLEQQADVLVRLGVPLPDQEKWVAVALINESATSEPEREQKSAARSAVGKERYADSNPMEKARDRAGMLSSDQEFQRWCGYLTEDTAASFIRRECGVSSRSYIATNELPYELFLKLEERFNEDVGRSAEMRA